MLVTTATLHRSNPNPSREYASARCFQHRGVHQRVAQHRAARARAAAIAGIDPTVIEIETVGTGHADRSPRPLEQVSDQASCRRLAVHAGNGDDRNTAGLSLREKHGDDGLSDWPCFSERRFEVHPQPRARVDLDDGSALDLERPANVCRNDVHAGNIQSRRRPAASMARAATSG